MEEKILKHSFKTRLRISQFDLNKNLTYKSIVSLFQDVACEHAKIMGMGFEDMFKKDLFWIVTRIKFDIIKRPQIYDDIIVETWVHESDRVDLTRDYAIKDLFGNLLIKGTSKWCLISSKTRKLVLPNVIEYPIGFEFCQDFNYLEKFIKTPFIERENEKVFEHVVSYHELDKNMHLNNVHYVDYVIDSIRTNEKKHFQINFIKECLFEDKIEVFSKNCEDGSILISGYVGEELKFSAYLL